MEEKKVLVGSSFSYAKRNSAIPFFKSLKQLSYQNKKVVVLDYSPDESFLNIAKVKGIEMQKVEQLETETETLAGNRNKLAKLVLEGGFDYFLSLEQELVVQPDLIQALLQHKKAVCSSLYFKPYLTKRQQSNDMMLNQMPSIFKLEGKETVAFKFPEIFPARLIKAGGCFLGAALIQDEVLRKVKFSPEEEALQFALDCKKNNFQIFADSSAVSRFVPSPVTKQ